MIRAGGSFFYRGYRCVIGAVLYIKERQYIASAVMDDALLLNENHTISCRVTRAGASLLSLQFPCSDMPQPGDSGSPILQEGKVVGMLSSVMFGNCTGTAVSSEVLRSLNS